MARETLCGNTLTVPPDGIQMLLWGSIDKQAGSTAVIKITAVEQDNVLMRIINAGSNSPLPGSGNGILLETADCFPIAYVSQDNLKARTYNIHHQDYSVFASCECEPHSSCVMFKQSSESGSRILSSLCIDMMGTFANIVGENNQLIGTLTPYNKVVCGNETNPKKDRCRVLHMAGGADAGLCITSVVVAMLLEIGDL